MEAAVPAIAYDKDFVSRPSLYTTHSLTTPHRLDSPFAMAEEEGGIDRRADERLEFTTRFVTIFPNHQQDMKLMASLSS